MNLANRMSTLTPSTTLAITAKANEMKANGIDVIGLGAGEPDFNTPSHIIQKAYESMLQGKTKYTPSGGLAELKKSIREKFLKDQKLLYSDNEIIVTNGAKHALYTLFQVVLNEGDEVIVPTPYWVSYPEQIKLAGGIPVFVDCNEENSFKLTPSALVNSISEKTKAVIINSPNNPTGIAYTDSELRNLGEICLDRNILIISDEIYEKIIFGSAKHVSIAELSNELKDQTIIINGVSKSHSMTGWRIGYAAGNQEIIKKMTSLASHSTSNPTTPSQYATIAAYNGSQDFVEMMKDEFEKRLNIIFEKINSIPGFSCIMPQGAFYLFPNVKEAAIKCGYENVDDFAKAILEEAHVALIPGSGFGSPDYVRLSYATSLENLENAISRIHQFVHKKWK